MSEYVETATDVNVEGVEFFVKETDDGYLYKEEACENKVDFETLKHAFEMGDVVVVDGTAKYRPGKFEVKKDNNNKDYAVVSYVIATENVETGDTILSLKEEKSASVE